MIYVKLLPELKPDTNLGEIERDFLLFVEQGSIPAQKKLSTGASMFPWTRNNFNVSKEKAMAQKRDI
jgi:hypothetical protein